MTARGISNTVIQHTADHEDVCLRHHRWLGAPEQQPLDYLTDVSAANRRHRTLARRIGQAFAAAYREARTAVSTWFTTADNPDLLDRWIRRLELLPEDPFGNPGHPSLPRIALIVCPEAVTPTADYLASHHEASSPESG